MANAFDSALIVNAISSQTLKGLANRLAPLRLFTNDHSSETKKAKETVVVEIASATDATQTNPTDFEPGFNTTVGASTVTLDHIYQPFGLSNADLANGQKLESVIGINVDAIADKIWSIAITPITTPNFGAAVATPGEISPGSTGLQTVWATVSKSRRKGLVLNSTLYSKFIPTSAQSLPLADGAYGFENGLHLATSFSGAVAGLDGFACSPEAICVASRQPDVAGPVADLFAIRDSVLLPDLGLTVYWNVWGSTKNRAVNCSLELMFGAAKGVTSGTMALII